MYSCIPEPFLVIPVQYLGEIFLYLSCKHKLRCNLAIRLYFVTYSSHSTHSLKSPQNSTRAFHNFTKIFTWNTRMHNLLYCCKLLQDWDKVTSGQSTCTCTHTYAYIHVYRKGNKTIYTYICTQYLQILYVYEHITYTFNR